MTWWSYCVAEYLLEAQQLRPGDLLFSVVVILRTTRRSEGVYVEGFDRATARMSNHFFDHDRVIVVERLTRAEAAREIVSWW